MAEAGHAEPGPGPVVLGGVAGPRACQHLHLVLLVWVELRDVEVVHIRPHLFRGDTRQGEVRLVSDIH